MDGLGTAYDVTLSRVKKKIAVGTITARYDYHNEPTAAVTLAVGILKNPSKFDFLVEKVTELGIREIIPMTTDRTILCHAKTDRWQKLALAAMKQCCRSFLPHVSELRSLSEVLVTVSSYDMAIVCEENTDTIQSLNSLVNSQSANFSSKENTTALILIGPE